LLRQLDFQDRKQGVPIIRGEHAQASQGVFDQRLTTGRLAHPNLLQEPLPLFGQGAVDGERSILRPHHARTSQPKEDQATGNGERSCS